MKTSEQINELATALALAQSEIKDAVMDAVNPHFKNEYATLDMVLKQIRPVFSKNGLAFVQAPRSDAEGHWLDTRVMHKSGQWIEETVKLALFKHDMQGLGAAITYARRYSAGAFAGIGSETDDDAQSISIPQSQKVSTVYTQKTDKIIETPVKKDVPPKVKNLAPVGGQEVANMITWIEKKNKSIDDILNHYEVSELRFLSMWQYEQVKERLSGN